MRKHQNIEEQKNIKILSLDDDSTMCAAVQAYFTASGYQVDTETDPNRAIERVKNNNYDILLLDFLMTPICGDKVVEAIRTFNSDLYIILLTGHKSMAPPIKTMRTLNIQGYYEKSDRFDQLELLVESCAKSIDQIRLIKKYQSSLEESNRRLMEANLSLQSKHDEIVNMIRATVDARDVYTCGHSDRVAILSEKMSVAMNRHEDETKRIRVTGLIHDVGKMKIPDGILLKESALSAEERKEIQQHPAYGAKIIAGSETFVEMSPGVIQHHERYDGTGYPAGLKGKNICEDARIIAIADAFDAMTSFRRYRVNMTPQQAKEEIETKSGVQFDPDIAKVFTKKVFAEFDEFSADSKWRATYRYTDTALPNPNDDENTQT